MDRRPAFPYLPIDLQRNPMIKQSNHVRSMVWRWIRRLIGAWFICAIAFGLYAWLFAWRTLDHYLPECEPAKETFDQLMDGAEYNGVIDTHARPFVVEMSLDAGGAVLVFGAEHTKDPNDPQITEILKRWENFEPTVALCESRLGILFPHLMDPLRTFAEPGFVHALASQKGIPTHTWEPPVDVLVNHLLNDNSREQVALRMILGPYFSNLRFGKPKVPDAFAEEFRKKRSKWPGIGGAFASMTALQAAWDRHFPAGPDWRDVSDQYGLPGFFADMDINLARDRHFLNVLVDLLNKGERVFAVAGSSHAVKLKPALEVAFKVTEIPTDSEARH